LGFRFCRKPPFLEKVSEVVCVRGCLDGGPGKVEALKGVESGHCDGRLDEGFPGRGVGEHGSDGGGVLVAAGGEESGDGRVFEFDGVCESGEGLVVG